MQNIMQLYKHYNTFLFSYHSVYTIINFYITYIHARSLTHTHTHTHTLFRAFFIYIARFMSQSPMK